MKDRRACKLSRVSISTLNNQTMKDKRACKLLRVFISMLELKSAISASSLVFHKPPHSRCRTRLAGAASSGTFRDTLLGALYPPALLTPLANKFYINIFPIILKDYIVFDMTSVNVQ